MKKYILLLLVFTSCHKVQENPHLISLQMIDRNGQTETISQTARIKLLEKQDFAKPQSYEKILRVYSKNNEGKNPSIITTYHKNGQLFQQLEAVDGRAHGNYIEFHDTGQIRIKAHVIEGTADLTELAQSGWVFDGPCTVYYQSGSQQAEFFYEKGKRTNDAKYFYQDGQIQKTLTFVDDLVEGDVCEFFQNGCISHTYKFIKGKQQGPSISFFPNNIIACNEVWDGDSLITGSYYDTKGLLQSSISNGTGVKSLYDDGALTTLEYKNGKLHGETRLYDKNSFPIQYYHILNNQKHGPESVFYEGTNVIKMNLEWIEDSITGIVKTFYKDGNLESQKSYSLNKKNGPSSAFYPSGDLMLLETYSQDRLISGSYFKKGEKSPASSVEDGSGKMMTFDEWGGVKQEITYEKGKVVLNDD